MDTTNNKLETTSFKPWSLPIRHLYFHSARPGRHNLRRAGGPRICTFPKTKKNMFPLTWPGYLSHTFNQKNTPQKWMLQSSIWFCNLSFRTWSKNSGNLIPTSPKKKSSCKTLVAPAKSTSSLAVLSGPAAWIQTESNFWNCSILTLYVPLIVDNLYLQDVWLYRYRNIKII